MGSTRGKAQKQSGYRGVCWSKVHRKWVSRFVREGRSYLVGYYENEHAAGAAVATAIGEYEADRARRAAGVALRVNTAWDLYLAPNAPASVPKPSTPPLTEQDRELITKIAAAKALLVRQ